VRQREWLRNNRTDDNSLQLIPLPLFFSSYGESMFHVSLAYMRQIPLPPNEKPGQSHADRTPVYPKAGFTAWVCISLIWLFVGLAMVGVYPAWEARVGLKKVCAGRALTLAGVLCSLSIRSLLVSCLISRASESRRHDRVGGSNSLRGVRGRKEKLLLYIIDA
jgi:hypothetical protein